mmetsp:Transcript_53552/g.160261  ORF Transcript_53552/g.160261 Transcript_53552/m.160261 type:complete len:464 (-) Transcript_53552:222-1613(-)
MRSIRRPLLRLSLASAALLAGGAADVAAFAPAGPQAAPRSPPAPFSPKASVPIDFASRERCRLWTASALDTTPVGSPPVVPEEEEDDAVGKRERLRRKVRSLLRRDGDADANSASRGSNRRMLRQNAFAIVAGLCLSFNAGFVNGACMSGLLHSSAARVSVAGFTGAYTQAGLALATGDAATFSFFARMIASFVGGSAISGLLNPKPVPGRMGPTYGPTFLVGSLLLAASSVLAFRSAPGLAVFHLAAAANGLQNGMSSMYTANLVRSCHMTGTSTDIGMLLGQILGGNRENAWKLLTLAGLASSFTLGGASSYLAVTKFRSLALAFNALFFLAIGAASVAFTAIEEHVTLWQAASGQWKWKSDGPPTAEELNELFDRIDADGSGYLDEEEMRTMLKEMGMIVSDPGVRAIFKMADLDGDGTISRDEFFGLILCDVDGEECSVEEPEVRTRLNNWAVKRRVQL